MKKNLLFIKSIVNQGAYFRASFLIDFHLKRLANTYYIIVYLFSLIFYTFITVSSIGIASENKINLNLPNGTVESINFLLFAALITLQTLIWKVIVSGINKQDNSILNIIKLNCKTRAEKVSTYYSTIFFNGFSFRIFLSGVLSTLFVTSNYFPDQVLFNSIITLLVLSASTIVLVSLECLIFYCNVVSKINTSVLTIALFVIGFISYNYLGKFVNLSLKHLLALFVISISVYILIRNFIKHKL